MARYSFCLACSRRAASLSVSVSVRALPILFPREPTYLHTYNILRGIPFQESERKYAVKHLLTQFVCVCVSMEAQSQRMYGKSWLVGLKGKEIRERVCSKMELAR